MIREEFVASGMKYHLFNMRLMKDMCIMMSSSVSHYNAQYVQSFERYKINWEMLLSDCLDSVSGTIEINQDCGYLVTNNTIPSESITQILAGVSINTKITACEKNLLSTNNIRIKAKMESVQEKLTVITKKALELSKIMYESIDYMISICNIKCSCNIPISVMEDFSYLCSHYKSNCKNILDEKFPKCNITINIMRTQLRYLKCSLDAKYEDIAIDTLYGFDQQLDDHKALGDYSGYLMRLNSKAITGELKCTCLPLYLEMMCRVCSRYISDMGR